MLGFLKWHVFIRTLIKMQLFVSGQTSTCHHGGNVKCSYSYWTSDARRVAWSGDRGAVVSRLSRLRAGRPGVRIPAGMWFFPFSKTPKPALGPTQLHIQCIPGGYSPGGTVAAAVSWTWTYTSTLSLSRPSWREQGNFTLTLLINFVRNTYCKLATANRWGRVPRFGLRQDTYISLRNRPWQNEKTVVATASSSSCHHKCLNFHTFARDLLVALRLL
jgi:hypothetical protein